jgi:hypothetical protein
MSRDVGAIRAQVIGRVRRDHHGPTRDDLAAKAECRAPGCEKQGKAGLDGFCLDCSREREVSGRWETRKLAEVARSAPIKRRMSEPEIRAAAMKRATAEGYRQRSRNWQRMVERYVKELRKKNPAV